MSAPAMNVRPAQTMTIAWTWPSAIASRRPSFSPSRTPWLSALTGGVFTVRPAMRRWRPGVTSALLAVMGHSSSRGGCRYHTPAEGGGLEGAGPEAELKRRTRKPPGMLIPRGAGGQGNALGVGHLGARERPGALL